MNVLIVHNYYQIPGGEDTVVATEKAMLESHGHRVILYTRSNAEWNSFSGPQKVMSVLGTVYRKKTFREVKELIQKEGVEVVHVHNTLSMITPSVYYAALEMKVPVVQTVHNYRLICPGAMLYREGRICEECIRNGLGCGIKNKCYRNSYLQTFLSTLTLWYHRRKGIYEKINYICLTRFNRGKLLSAGNAAKKQLFDPERIYVKGNCAAGELGGAKIELPYPYYLYAGRLDETKGVKDLLEAWKWFPGAGGSHLVICGTGPLETWCREYIANGKLEMVHMMGQVSREEVARYLKGAKALILPTRWYEGFPMSIVEAFQCGTPVITSDVGNAADLVEEGVTGLHFPMGNPLKLAQTLGTFDAMEVPWKENVQKVFAERFSPEQNYRELMDIYEKVIEKQKNE